ncbi:SMR family transporter [Streptosporangium sp. KLBMP 9127]|nr:SMR family transporter [Streptosporangium sp. KLBMP 9127]
MAWLVLFVSGILETVWAVALDKSEAFSKPLATTVFVVALILSMIGLGWALRDIPVGTAYAIWVGIGAIGTAVVGMAWLGESASLPRIACLLLVVAGVVGLKIYH